MRRLLTAVIATAVFPQTSLLAQDSPQTRVEDFDPMEISGSVAAPDVVLVVGGRAEFGTLIELRASFVDELVASAAEIANHP